MRITTLYIILCLFYINTNAQPCTTVKEYNRKRHTISVGSNEKNTYGHPYTMFDKHNGLSFEQTIVRIRKRIIDESPESIKGPVFRAYQMVYENANNPKPTDDGLGPKVDGKYIGFSSLAIWAKNCAFVFLIGLDANGNKFEVFSSMFEVKLTHN